MNRRLMLACMVATIAGTTGCSLPEVTLNDALLTKLTPKGFEIGLNLNIFNPNDYALPLNAVDWDLDLFRSDFTSGNTAFSPGGRRCCPLDDGPRRHRHLYRPACGRAPVRREFGSGDRPRGSASDRALHPRRCRTGERPDS